MPASDCFVSVVAPLYNNEAIIEDYVSDVMEVLCSHYENYELVLVDDGSSDATAANVERLLRQHECVRFIQLSRKYGEEIAISAGLDSAIGDFVVIMLPDMDPVDRIPDMVAAARAGSGVVVGVRTNRPARLWIEKTGSDLFYAFCRDSLDLPLIKDSTQFRVLSRQAVNAITQIRDRYRYIRIFSILVGYQSTSLPYQAICRSGKEPRRSLMESINLAVDIVVANSKRPLRFVSWLGLFASGLNLLYIAYIVLVNLVKQTVEGWTTSSLQNATIFFFILLILTVLSEYIGRILEETRNRPLYFVMGEKNSSVMLANPERRNIVTESKNIRV